MLVGRLWESDAGFVFAARSGRQSAAIVMLTAGAEKDSYGRARFVRQLEFAEADSEHPVLAAELEPDVAPWVAVAVPSWEVGRRIGRELLAPVTLDDVPHLTPVAGPTYRPHWHHSVTLGRWRLWPLPWPRALSSAGRWTYVVSFGLVLLIASLALLVAVKIFENQPPTPPPPAPNPPGPTPPSPTDRPTPTPTPSSPGTEGPTTPGQTGQNPIPPIV